MIINSLYLWMAAPIKDMLRTKEKAHGVSYGLSEVGYDIRVKQQVTWIPPDINKFIEYSNPENVKFLNKSFINDELQEAFHGCTVIFDGLNYTRTIGRTALASSIEEFELPDNLWGELRNKSTHARQMFDATLGTDMEPGWKGNLTIEIIFHGLIPITIPLGSGIAKAVFHEIKEPVKYQGKYQNQEDKPVPSIYD